MKLLLILLMKKLSLTLIPVGLTIGLAMLINIDNISFIRYGTLQDSSALTGFDNAGVSNLQGSRGCPYD